ncbi:hypothetical protein HYE68_005462 [Fusarium pseudograminearum]|nr:hypothetical protein HYE68_005462 [Fusarium pseudograminearum]
MSNLRRQQSMGQTLATGESAEQGYELPELGEDVWIEYEPPKPDIKAIYAYLELHKSFEPHPGYTVSELPKFDDFTTYGNLTEEEELDFCRIEVNRLVSAATSPGAIALDGPRDLFGLSTNQGYLQLHHLGRKLRQAVTICQHDAALIQAEHMDGVLDHKGCARLQARLVAEFDPNSGKERFAGAQNTTNENQMRIYHALLNYMTGILVKIVLCNIRGDYWVNNLIAVVARITAKLKILGKDIPRSVELTLQSAADTRVRISQRQRQMERFTLQTPNQLGEDIGEESCRVPLAGEALKYFIDMERLHDLITEMLIGALTSFTVADPTATITNDFESSVAMYASLITGEQALIYQGRDGSIGAASKASIARTFTAGFRVCLEVWEDIQPEPAWSAKDWTSIEWDWSMVELQQKDKFPTRQGKLKLSSMRDIIRATVPFFMISGHAISQISEMIDIMMFTTSRHTSAPLRLIKQPRATCKGILQTSTYVHNRLKRRAGGDNCPLSETYLLQSRAGSAACNPRPLTDTVDTPGRKNRNSSDLSADPEKTKRLMAAAKKQLDKWTISNNAIVVPYKRYAWSWIAVSTILVFGGLAVGFSTGNTILGVDPFNISIFCWALAGFTLVVAKAVRVENWPWSAFLRGLVHCRSVTEVNAVTGVDDQILLALLLGIDRRTYLKTTGPYNTLFLRCAEDVPEGFSVDIPILSTTAMEGGLIPIKILGEFGPGFVFIYTHSWAPYNSAGHATQYKGHDMSRDMSWTTRKLGDKDIPGYRLKTRPRDNYVFISKVLGVLDQDCCFC